MTLARAVPEPCSDARSAALHSRALGRGRRGLDSRSGQPAAVYLSSDAPALLELAAAQPQPHAPTAPRAAADADGGGARKRARVGAERAPHEMLTAKANERMRGHTAFLTFADL